MASCMCMSFQAAAQQDLQWHYLFPAKLCQMSVKVLWSAIHMVALLASHIVVAFSVADKVYCLVQVCVSDLMPLGLQEQCQSPPITFVCRAGVSSRYGGSLMSFSITLSFAASAAASFSLWPGMLMA